MGIRIAIAAVSITATVATEIVFSVEEGKKQEELEEAISNAHEKIDEANDFYQNVYKDVKTRLDNLRQGFWKLPSDVVDKLNEELILNSSEPDQFWKYAGLVLGITESVVVLFGLFFVGLASAGIAEADGTVADIGTVVAVAGFALTLLNGVTPQRARNEAIDNVNGKQQQAEDAMADMKKSLDGLLTSLGLKAGSYYTLKDISFDDWDDFNRSSTAFNCRDMTVFSAGEGQSHAANALLRDNVPALAKLIEKNISVMNETGKIQLSMDSSQPQVDGFLTDWSTPSFKADVTSTSDLAKLIQENISKMNATGKLELTLSHQPRKRKSP